MTSEPARDFRDCVKDCLSSSEVVLLDSLKKRINFLDAVVEKLGLEDVETLHGRAEDFAKQTAYREQFDLCVSRAVQICQP